ncbi:hypothetical protein TNCV_2941461 [Trichonephila clavipes]|nr:hypothetical protein TNCV_2941461 [Trichonephila clavipes]
MIGIVYDVYYANTLAIQFVVDFTTNCITQEGFYYASIDTNRPPKVLRNTFQLKNAQSGVGKEDTGHLRIGEKIMWLNESRYTFLSLMEDIDFVRNPTCP